MARRDARDKTTAPATVKKAALPQSLPPLAAAALVFVAAGAVLVLEILAVRLLAPYVGLTLETTTSIIGAALAGIALGAAVGGRLADRTNTRSLVVWLLIGGGLLALLTVPIVRWLGPGARGDGDLAALAITVVALVPPAAVLSAVSPAVAHLQLHDLRSSGTVVGGLSAWATAGALLGTFGSGFVLVPLMAVSTAILAIGLLLVVAGIALGATSRRMSLAAAAGAGICALALAGSSSALDSPCDAETEYHCASVEVDPSRASGRHLILDDQHHSYVDLRDPTYLQYPYARWIAEAVNSFRGRRRPLDAVVVGGGGFTLPRWFAATRPGSKVQVLEVDGELIDFVEERFGLRESPALQISVGDARVGMLDVATNSADVVVGDAFGKLAAPWHLATAEWTDQIRRVLAPGGLYALNVVDYPPLDLLKAETATLLDAFAHVELVTFAASDGRPEGGNAVLFASDRPLPGSIGLRAGAKAYDRRFVEAFTAGTRVLSDDNAPVDQLLTIRREPS
jgi:spermidine synthase